MRAVRRRGGSVLRAAAGVFLAGVLGAAQPIGAAPKTPSPTYVVTEFLISFALDHPKHPPIEALRALQVDLVATRAGYRAPRLGERGVPIQLGSPPQQFDRYQASAIQAISHAIVEDLNRRGIDAVLVTVPDLQERTGKDLRPPGEERLRIKIWTGRVVELSTFASGERFDDLPIEQRMNHPAHAWILERSPLQVGGDSDLIRSDELDEFAARASRHPGRHVEAKLSPGDLPGTSRVQYRVTENRPWFTYFQVSNTGTAQTTKWRERFGFVDNQLTGRDDILRFDYLSGSFTHVNGVWGSYEIPAFVSTFQDRLRGQVSGSWSQYDASEVGISGAGFEGQHWDVGGKFQFNVAQHGDWFVDLVAGLRWQNEQVDNKLLVTHADENFFLPEFGVSAQRQTPISSFFLTTDVLTNLDGVAGTNPTTSQLLGRIDPDVDFTIMHWDASLAFYLEPVLNRVAWEDPRSPSSSTLAHELAMRFWGQTSFGNRLVPQFQQIVGGLYTVRGYEQAILAGDTVMLGSIEYRFHLPRALSPHPTTRNVPILGQFRDRPQFVYGRPDWDLIFRVFYDVANVRESQGDFYGEPNQTIQGIGGGLELQILTNLTVRCDVGFAIDEVPGIASAWSVEPHFLMTLVY